jgi:NADPH:quinone reductase
MSEHMRVIRIREPGPPDVLEIESRPRPDPGPEEVRVAVAASGLNRADLLQRLGRYPAPEGYPQDILGMEFSGVVDRVGARVSSEWDGRTVMGITGGGAYAEYLIARPEELVLVPGTLGAVDAGAVPEVFMTAFDAMVLQGALEEGETVLVHAVGSGVGTAALQIAVRAGATVIGTSRTDDKLRKPRRSGSRTVSWGMMPGPTGCSRSRTDVASTSCSISWAERTSRGTRRCWLSGGATSSSGSLRARARRWTWGC